MKRYLLIILIIAAISQAGVAQIQEKAPPELTEDVVKQNNFERACVERNNYSPKQRLRFYPFNKASQATLVSFSTKNKDLRDRGELPMDGKEVNYSKLKEIGRLTYKQVEELTNILFNYGYRGVPIFETNMLCYNPKNAILFSDSKGKTLAYIEICFECENSKPSSDKINLGDECIGKYKLLRNFFANNGIVYGIKRINK